MFGNKRLEKRIEWMENQMSEMELKLANVVYDLAVRNKKEEPRAKVNRVFAKVAEAIPDNHNWGVRVYRTAHPRVVFKTFAAESLSEAVMKASEIIGYIGRTHRRYAQVGALKNGRMLTNSVHLYRPETNSWTKLPDYKKSSHENNESKK